MLQVVYPHPEPIIDLRDKPSNISAQESLDLPLPIAGKIVAAKPRVYREIGSFLKFEGHLEEPPMGLFPLIDKPVVIAPKWLSSGEDQHGVVGYPVYVSSTESDYRAVCSKGIPAEYAQALFSDASVREQHPTDRITLLVPSREDGWEKPRLIVRDIQSLIPLEELLSRGDSDKHGVGVVLQPQNTLSQPTSFEPLFFQDGKKIDALAYTRTLLDRLLSEESRIVLPRTSVESKIISVRPTEIKKDYIVLPNEQAALDALCILYLGSNARFNSEILRLDQSKPSAPDVIGEVPRALEYRRLQQILVRIGKLVGKPSEKEFIHYTLDAAPTYEDRLDKPRISASFSKVAGGYLLSFDSEASNAGGHKIDSTDTIQSEIESAAGVSGAVVAVSLELQVSARNGWSTLSLNPLSAQFGLKPDPNISSGTNLHSFRASGIWNGYPLSIGISASSDGYNNQFAYIQETNSIIFLNQSDTKKTKGTANFEIRLSPQNRGFTLSAQETDTLLTAREALQRALT